VTLPLGYSLRQAALAELIATAFLLIAVVGSGIAAERLSSGIVGLALLANALATAAALFALILTFGPISGAHMNPVVTLAAALVGSFEKRTAAAYIGAQIAGAVIGVWLSHLMFDLSILQTGTHVRAGVGQFTAEIVATFGLLGVIWGCLGYGTPTAAGAIAAYIGGAYWFTASTSFANPAVTIARALTDTFAGIRPSDASLFITAQGVALILALPVLRHIIRRTTR
jgi:glycerol uptake facilitator-like aquaporin